MHMLSNLPMHGGVDSSQHNAVHRMNYYSQLKQEADSAQQQKQLAKQQQELQDVATESKLQRERKELAEKYRDEIAREKDAAQRDKDKETDLASTGRRWRRWWWMSRASDSIRHTSPLYYSPQNQHHSAGSTATMPSTVDQSKVLQAAACHLVRV